MEPTTKMILDIRREKAESKYPVKLRITFERRQKYYKTKYDLTEKEFTRAMQGERQTKDEKLLRGSIQAYENKATAIIEDMPLFNWKTFEKRYLANRGAKDTINQAFADYITGLRNGANLGTAVVYECSQSSLNKFAPGVKFADITTDFLKTYEKWMLGNGNSVTTISIYLRALRTLFNNAIADGELTKDVYPFGKKKYEIPTGSNTKKALTLNDISKIYHYKPKAGTVDAVTRDYWIFMYLCNGINVKDMCLLTYGNIKGDVLEFERAKTARTKRKVEPIRVALVDDLKRIIKKHGNTHKDGSTFIFPILKAGLKPERQRQLIQQVTRVINNHMKAIAGKLKITADVNTYSARHSFATILQRSGASTEFISEALGHSNVRTTQNYLAGFEDDSKRETVKALTAFKNTGKVKKAKQLTK